MAISSAYDQHPSQSTLVGWRYSVSPWLSKHLHIPLGWKEFATSSCLKVYFSSSKLKLREIKLSRHLCQVNPNSAHSFCNTSVGIIQLKVLPFTCPSTSVHLNVPFHSYGLLRSEIHNGSASGLSPHSEETGSLSDLYLPGSPDSVQLMHWFVMSKGQSVRIRPCLQLSHWVSHPSLTMSAVYMFTCISCKYLALSHLFICIYCCICMKLLSLI